MSNVPMRRLALLLAAAVFALTATPALADHAGPGSTTYTWPTHSAVVEDRTGIDAVREAARYAVSRWNDAGADLHLTYRDGPATNSCDFEGNVISICHDNWSAPDDRLGETHLAWTGATSPYSLTGAWIRLQTWVAQGIGSPNIVGIVAHEIGHAICCLDHSTEVSIMNGAYTNAHCGFECSGPDQHDNEVLIQLYGPGSSPTTTTTAPPTTTTTAPPVTTTTAPPVTTTTAPPTTTTTAPPVTTTTAPPVTTTVPLGGYCGQLRTLRAQLAAHSSPWFAANQSQALAAIDAVLASCP